ncbi:ankyrin repeat domain-containing protein [Rickettsia sp. TH2014]|uniref:ankyrin repeat domain-containing protein n=1 Tax=Rickettsia sp. TH2014 TaxID=1967503 RepID=UPI003532643D
MKCLYLKCQSRLFNHVNNNGDTALILATSKALSKVCEMLIPKMSEQAISQVTNNGETALSLATKHGFKNIYDLLTNKKII